MTGHRQWGRSYGIAQSTVHVAEDHATRMAYVEVLEDKQTPMVGGYLSHTVAWFNSKEGEFRRVMSDNGPTEASNELVKVWRTLGLRHL